LSALDAAALRQQVIRMLRLRDADDAVAKRFAAGSPDLTRRGPVGRLFRSPSLFEDLVKTFTLCNCGWARSLKMNEALCNVVGEGAFPTAAEVAKVPARRLRARCGVGYRAERIVRLAREVLRGHFDLDALESADSSAAEQQSASIFGLGPFGVANVMQLLGHYETIPADSETARHLRQARGLRFCSLDNVRQLAAAVYAGFAPLQFMRYWTELWHTYEDRMGGKAHEVDPEQYRLLTAAHMSVPRQSYAKRAPKAWRSMGQAAGSAPPAPKRPRTRDRSSVTASLAKRRRPASAS